MVDSKSNRRRLASDERSGRYARRGYRNAYRNYLRLHWQWLLIGALVFLGITAVVALVVRGQLLRGIVIGFGVAGTIGALSHFVVISSGAAPLMMGELAEQWTAQELRHLIESGWRVINHFPLLNEDVDHLVIGTAGIFVIETKWSGLRWQSSYGDRDVDRAVRQAQRAADKLSSTAMYRQLTLPPPNAKVVLWGAGAASLADRLSRQDVIAGSELRSRLEAFGLVKAQLSVGQVESAWQALSNEALARDAAELEADPIPASIHEMALMAAAILVSGLTAFFGSAGLMTAPIALWGRGLAIAALGAAAHPLRHWPRLRLGVTAWQAGAAAALLLVGAVAGDQILR
jgi:hypothetical protein